MPEGQIAQGVKLLDLMLEYFADDGHWTRGRYDDGNGGHCLVGALLHFEVKGWKVSPSHYVNQDLGRSGSTSSYSGPPGLRYLAAAR